MKAIQQNFVPDRGDILTVNLSPTVGHEQRGVRPVFVVTPKFYNAKVGMVVICPITKHAKGYSFEVNLEESGVEGVVLSDQVRTIDFRTREAKFMTRVGEETVCRVLKNLNKLINLTE